MKKDIWIDNKGHDRFHGFVAVATVVVLTAVFSVNSCTGRGNSTDEAKSLVSEAVSPSHSSSQTASLNNQEYSPQPKP